MSARRISQRFVDRAAKKPKLEQIQFLEEPKFIPNPENNIQKEPKPKRGRGRPRRQPIQENAPPTGVLTQLETMATYIADADTTQVNRQQLPIDIIKRHAPANHYGNIIDDINARKVKVDNNGEENDDSDIECLDPSLNPADDVNPFELIKKSVDKLPPPAKFEFKSLWSYRLPDLKSVEEPWKNNIAKPDFVPDVLSIVASMFVGQRLDLKEIAMKSRNIEYNPDRFAPLIMRVRSPKSTSLIFASGKMIVTGTRSEAECKLAARKYARVIQRLGYKRVKVLNFEIQNISASTNLKFNVRLRNLAQNPSFKGIVSYEPEMFPGLVYPLEHPKVKSIIFCSGAVLMTGARSEQELEVALNTIYPAAKMYGH